MFSVKDKVIIVTGAIRGNGRAIADGLWLAGAKICYVDIEPFEGWARKELTYKCDITNKNDILSTVHLIMGTFGRIDGLVNNAGVTFPNDDPHHYENVWDRTMNTNLKGTYMMMNRVSEMMKLNRRGSIVNITSISAEQGMPGNPSYVASKGGLKMLGKAMALELAPWNIRVNNIGPGYMKTSMTERSYNDPELKLARDKRIMLGRWGEPKDLIGPCIFLLSEASSYVTGIDLMVDGGWTAKGL